MADKKRDPLSHHHTRDIEFDDMDRRIHAEIINKHRASQPAESSRHERAVARKTSRRLIDRLRTPPRVAASLAAIAIVGGVATKGVDTWSLLRTGDNAGLYQKIRPGSQERAVRNSHEVQQKQYLLKAGTPLRLTPQVLDGEPQYQLPNNQAGKVPEDKEWRVFQPIYDEAHPGWIGFLKPGDDSDIPTDSVADRASRTVWVNIDEAESKGLAVSGRYATTYSGEQETLAIHFNKYGDIIFNEPQPIMKYGKLSNGHTGSYLDHTRKADTVVATSFEEPAGSFTFSMEG